jgi:hypothetical protein
MKVYEHSDPDSLKTRSHPWLDAESDSTCRYYDFRTHPELIRTSLEDLQQWNASPAAETFYRLIEWLNGTESCLESNDCALSGATITIEPHPSKPWHCSGRLMILYRDLALNTSPEQIQRLTNATAQALSEADLLFEWGAVAATIVSTRFTALPGPPERQKGQQLMLSFWVWGETEPEMMAHLDRLFHNLTGALREVSDEIRRKKNESHTCNGTFPRV